jgi:nicotinamidase/pyrazinamidase
VRDLAILGLATDYCVKFTVLDACRLGYNVTVIQEGCRGIDLQPGDIERAYDEMRHLGAIIA